MDLEFDVQSFVVDDEFVGTTRELRRFIIAVTDAGGTVEMVSHDTARIMSLPKKAKATKKPESPVPTLKKEVEPDADQSLRVPSPQPSPSPFPVRPPFGSDSANAD